MGWADTMIPTNESTLFGEIWPMRALYSGPRTVLTTGWWRTPGANGGGTRATSRSREGSACAASGGPTSSSPVRRGRNQCLKLKKVSLSSEIFLKSPFWYKLSEDYKIHSPNYPDVYPHNLDEVKFFTISTIKTSPFWLSFSDLESCGRWRAKDPSQLREFWCRVAFLLWLRLGANRRWEILWI